MFFDDNSEEKKLFEDIQFKRRVAFVDDDDISCMSMEPFSKVNQNIDIQDRGCQVNFLNEAISSASQTRTSKHRETQTEIDEASDRKMHDGDLSRVLRILQKRSDIMEDAILENIYTTAFNNYDVDWYGGGSVITNPFVLANEKGTKEDELQVVAVEWNSTCTTVCCAYGRCDHESVCTHKGSLCTWNIDRLKLDKNKPDIQIETNVCISSLATHPEYPGIIAAGFFNGEVNVYDIRQTDQLVASILDKKELHRDEVTSLKWIKDNRTTKKKFLLLSGSRDGKILIWNALPTKNQLKLVAGHLILIDHLTRKHFKSIGTEMGISSIAMNNQDKEIFLVGCDSGGLFKCSLSSQKKVSLKWDDEDSSIEFYSPVELAFDAQHGPIYSISHSPFHRNLILTCGTDSEIKMYSLLQTSSVMNLCPDDGYLYCIEWSPTRPCVFACGTHKGNILVYDLMETGSNLCQIIKASDHPIYTLSFNVQRPGFLASGDRMGVVKIWRLSQNLTKINSDETKKLNDISEKPFEKN